MRIFVKIISFIFKWVTPFIIVYVNHISLESGGYSLNMMGFVIVASVILVAFIKFNKRVDLWAIQDKNKVIRSVYGGIKTIGVLGGIVWLLHAVDDNMVTLTNTFTLLFISITFGILLNWILILFPKD